MTNLPYQGLPSWPAYLTMMAGLESAMLHYHLVVAEFIQVAAAATRLHRSIYGALR